LGTVVAELLVRAGVGGVTIIDRDTVQWDNLHRQGLFTERDARRELPKAAAAVAHLKRIRRRCELRAEVADINSRNIRSLIEGHDLLIDAVDTFQTRMLINDAALSLQLPWVHGGAIGATGQVAFFGPQGGPCFRCLVPQLPPQGSVDTCDTVGVMPPITHAIASLQAMHAMQWLAGQRDGLGDSLWSIDVWTRRSRTIDLRSLPSDQCPACARGQRDWLDDVTEEVTILCGRNTVQIRAASYPRPGDRPPLAAGTPGANPGSGVLELELDLDLDRIESMWRGAGPVQRNAFFIRLIIGAHSLTLFRDGRLLVGGTEDPHLARSLQARWLGG
jgi:molybdopterin-synthase adenylyltransferase